MHRDFIHSIYCYRMKHKSFSKIICSFICLCLFQSTTSWATCDNNGSITGTNTSSITLGTGTCANNGDFYAELVSGASIDVTGTAIYVTPSMTTPWTINLDTGSTITGTGGADGIATSDGTGVQPITLNNGGTVNVGLSGFLLPSGATVTNTGTIIAGFNGIDISTSNGGTIVNPVYNSSVYNSGTIVGGTTGVHLGLGGTITNTSSGTIDGLFAIQTEQSENGIPSSAVTLNNSGTIGNLTTTNTGVLIISGGTINNYAGSSILAHTYGVAIQSGTTTINNAGTIHAAGGRGVYFEAQSDGGSVYNSGLIQGDGTRGLYFAVASGVVVNTGTIQGGTLTAMEMDNGYATVTNSGTISSASGLAILIRNGGNNTITNNGGTINGNVQLSSSNDQFLMNGGLFNGKLLMGSTGNETATFQNDTDTNIGGVTLFNGGGGGSDQLIFDNTQHTGGSDIVNWETVNLNNNSALTLSSNLTLGGTSADATATLNINSSSLNANDVLNSIIQADVSTNPALVNNAGTINLASPNSNNSLIIRGNYVGNGGYVDLNAVLNSDGSPADKLVIDGQNNSWSASGNTLINVNNTTGTGALTTSNGILVVEAINDATTTPTAFTLNNPIRVGAYDYRLFRGGLNANDSADAQNWFLRSTFAESAPIIGPEISVYSSATPTILEMNRMSIGVWHERVGNNDNSNSTNSKTARVNGGWMRSFNQTYSEHMTVIKDPEVSAVLIGVQGGLDLYRKLSASGSLDVMGFYIGYTDASLSINGVVTNAENTAYVYEKTGSVRQSSSLGGLYWTHTLASEAYIDLVAQGSYYDGTAISSRTSLPLIGGGASGSIEAGYPFKFYQQWALEPQGQLLYDYTHFNETQDGFSSVSIGATSTLMGRAGFRLVYSMKFRNHAVVPFLRANYWSILAGSRGSSTVFGGDDTVVTTAASNWEQFGGGFRIDLGHHVDFYGFFDDLVTLGGSQNSLSGIDAGVGIHGSW